MQHYVADTDLIDDVGVVIQNDDAVEGDEILNRLTLAKDLIRAHVPYVRRLAARERPMRVEGTPRSLLIVRGLDSRAPPASALSG